MKIINNPKLLKLSLYKQYAFTAKFNKLHSEQVINYYCNKIQLKIKKFQQLQEFK